MPWGHLAFGYVLVSIFTRVVAGRPPRDREALVVLVATQLPDLVDKPLGWGFSLYATGYGAAHSVLVVVPLFAPVVAYAIEKRSMAALVFPVAYLSHLAGDVLAALAEGSYNALGRVLWPVSSFPTYAHDRGVVGRAVYYLGRFAHELADPAMLAWVAAYLLVFVAVFALWVYDGAPGTGLVRAFRRRVAAYTPYK